MINNSFGPILLILVLSVLLILIFSLLKRNLPFLSKSIKKNKKFVQKLYLIEIVLGVLIITIFSGYLFYRSTVMFAVLFMLLGFAVFFLGVFFFKDYLAGLIIKASADYELNDILVFESYEGKIIKFSKRYILMLSNNGDKIFIPYSKIVSGIKYVKESHDSINSHSFNIKCEISEKTDELSTQISKYIITLPWVNNSVLPDISTKTEDKEFVEFNITVYSLDSKYHQKIEDSVIDMF